MKKQDAKLIWIFVGILVIALAVALFADPNMQLALQPVGDYHIQITEICAKNESIIASNSGKYCDYIELYNTGDTVDLSGCRLTDGTVTTQPFEGVTMAKGEYRLVFLEKDVLGFSLSSSGRDTVQLQDPNGHVIAQAKVQTLTADQVMLLQNGSYQLSSAPSPGYPNTDSGVKAFREGTPVSSLSLQISEVLLSNRSVLPDEKGAFSDIIELYNPTDTPVPTSGWCLSDSVQQRLRYRLPDAVIPAGGYLLLYCDGDNYTADSFIHTNFSLNREETLCLTDPAGNYVTLALSYAGENLSLANTDGTYVPMVPSLGYPNTEEGCYSAQTARVNPDSPLVISEVLLSDACVPYMGQFTDAVELYNRSSQTVNTAGWYLSDGGDAYAFPLPQQELAPGEYVAYPIGKQFSDFGLSEGETLYLMGPDHKLSIPVTCAVSQEGYSISLVDSSNASYDFLPVTMGYANDQAGEELFVQESSMDGLRISELMSSNSSYLYGPYGNTTDWVELYNAGSSTVQLSDYALTDSSNLKKYPLPEGTLAPGKYTVILLSETGKNLQNGYAWLPFNLSSSGDRLYLTKDGKVVDYTIIPELSGNTAWGRPAGKLTFSQLASPTPGAGNSAAASFSQMPEVNLPQGSYDDVGSLTVSFSAPGDIYYTTDCSVPTRSSRHYTGPITITQTTVFRVAAYEEGASRSQILDLTYLVNEGDSLEAVCVVTTPGNLWDYSYGIYVGGPGMGTEYPYQGANYWKNWERSSTVSLFEKDGSVGFSESCGLKIFGGYSRANDKKSFACMFRGKYGASSLDYPLFGDAGIDTYQSFVLRAGGQDAYGSKVRDEMITSIASDYLGLPVQLYRPVNLYLNGTYWGIYFIREKITDQYVAGNFGVYAEDVTLGHWSGEDVPAYVRLQNYARTYDLSQQKHYDYICSQINVDNYIDYTIAQIWIDNQDLGNVKFFRTDELPWHWILFDTDLAFLDVSRNSVQANLTKSNIWAFDYQSKVLVVKLLKNPEFRDKFIRRMAYQFTQVWTEENVVARVDYFEALLQDDIAKECNRWGGSPEGWRQNLEWLRDFARKRNSYVIPYVQRFFGLSDAQMQQYGFEV